MKKYLPYITTLIASFTVASCLEDPYLDGCPEETSVPVQLMLSFADNAPTSRDVSSSDTDLDYTTDPQSAMTQDDVYILVFNEDKTELLYLVDDLTLGVVQNDGYYTRALNGTMKSTTGGENVSLVILANLNNQGISIGTSTVKEYLLSDACMGKSAEAIYNNLVYQYNTDDDANATEPWNIDNRRIPMWGEITNIAVPNNGVTVDCYLYRALAKVQIWVNMKDGIDGFVINSITVNNIHTKGYCVSQANFDDDSPHYAGTNGFKPYVAPYPYIPANEEEYSYQSVTYNSIPTEDGKTKFFSDMIYLPEQVNKGATEPVTITVNYTYKTVTQDGIIRFTEGGVEDQSKAFDIIRNHSYIFNINYDAEPAMYYEVIDWTSVNNGTLNFGNGDGNVTTPNGNTTIE